MYVLTVKQLGKRYTTGIKHRRELWALRDVSFALSPGQILGIIGPNGAGKTTLLKILARITPPTEGRVFGRGRVVPLLALGAGFQRDLSGRENILLNAAMSGTPAGVVERRMDEIIEFSGIGGLIDMPVKRYSSGMYLRLAFSVAINLDPDILLADEVLAVGDLEFQERCLERVQQAGRAGMSVLFVSHDMTAITRLCDRVLWLDHGHAVQLGPPDEVVAAYQNSAWSIAGRRHQRSKGGTHKCEHGEITFVTLASPDGREIGAAKASDETLIKVGLRLERGGLKARFEVHVLTHGTAAFRVRSPFYAAEGPGAYAAVLRVPANLLADTLYSVNVEVVVMGIDTPGKWVLTAFGALSFQVFSQAAREKGLPEGAVAPRVEWEFQGGAAAAVGPAKTGAGRSQ
jgi:ABC-type polysaccharide/polyol phosphate transport system ATPase subunit